MTDFDKKLIELVRANPVLVCLSAEPYETINKKRELWHSLATSLKVDVKTCISRWKYLRDKLRLELQKEKRGECSVWPLLEHMRFAAHQTKYYSIGSVRVPKIIPNSSNNSTVFTEVIDEETLQEAMDEQHNITQSDILIHADDRLNDTDIHEPPTSYTSNMQSLSKRTLIVDSIAASKITSADHLKRIESLLEGLSESNRHKAEKRIIAFLCKCNIYEINNEHINDLHI